MNSFRVALLGDSMFARWGARCPQLQVALKRQYQRSEFEIFNHGLAGSRAGNGLWRISHRYNPDLETHSAFESQATAERRDSLHWCNPYLVIIESFAYTNRIDGAEGLSEYRDLLRRMVETIQHTTEAKILFCVTMAPLRDSFLETAPTYVNTSRATRQRFADDVALYLDEARRIAQDERWPLADVAAEIQKRVDAGENPQRFVDHDDFQHLSPYGLEIQARVIVRAIDNGRMVEETSTH